MLKLLILTAVYTGHGHKSISDALEERLRVYDDLCVKTIDGFDLMNSIEKACAEKTYGPITRMPGKAWEWNYELGTKLLEPVQRVVGRLIERRFLKLIKEFQPDCILSVHPMFIGSILDCMEQNGINIPLIVHEADLNTIPPQWFDKRTALTLATCAEARECSLRGRLSPDKVQTVCFPVRSRFIGRRKPDEKLSEPMTITVMSGSEGSGTLKAVVKALLKSTDAHVNVICGRNKKIRKDLKKKFEKKNHARLNVMGFVEKIEDVMLDSDILILRASPNSVMEAVALNKPVILFGQLAGQEKRNPEMLCGHGLAKYCPVADALGSCIAEMTKNNGAGIKEMRRRQREYMPDDGAVETARIIYEFVKNNEKRMGE